MCNVKTMNYDDIEAQERLNSYGYNQLISDGQYELAQHYYGKKIPSKVKTENINKKQKQFLETQKRYYEKALKSFDQKANENQTNAHASQPRDNGKSKSFLDDIEKPHKLKHIEHVERKTTAKNVLPKPILKHVDETQKHYTDDFGDVLKQEKSHKPRNVEELNGEELKEAYASTKQKLEQVKQSRKEAEDVLKRLHNERIKTIIKLSKRKNLKGSVIGYNVKDGDEVLKYFGVKEYQTVANAKANAETFKGSLMKQNGTGLKRMSKKQQKKLIEAEIQSGNTNRKLREMLRQM